MHAAIPTQYKGVNFRSRLEATWAAFFDIVGIEWRYEPYDLFGYIPDFGLSPSGDEEEYFDWLVEVKPIVMFSDLEHDNALLKAAVTKAKATGWTGNAIIVGSFPTRTLGRLAIGGVCARNGKYGDPMPAALLRCTHCNSHWFGKYGYDTHCLDFRCRCTHGETIMMRVDDDLVMAYWAKARNAAQWKRVA